MQRWRAIEIGVDELQGKLIHERTHRLWVKAALIGRGGNSCSDRTTFNRSALTKFMTDQSRSVDEPGALHGGGNHSVERIRAHAHRNLHLRGLVAIQ
jgi:hypothetical protein